jgi:hypothetical protein
VRLGRPVLGVDGDAPALVGFEAGCAQAESGGGALTSGRVEDDLGRDAPA